MENDENLLEECVVLNQQLPINHLVKLTWGNASIRTQDKEHFVIKPSGVPFNDLTPEKMAVVNLVDGKHIAGLKPSVDSEIHRAIYQGFDKVNSVIHTHSKYATAWAQAGRPIPLMGTTHADYFVGDIPVIPLLTPVELGNYETNLGASVVSYYEGRQIDPLSLSAVLLASHGTLVFHKDPEATLESALVLEEVAELALMSEAISGQFKIEANAKALFDIHFTRKHGRNRYYGQ